MSIFLDTRPISDYSTPSFEDMGLSPLVTERMFNIYDLGEHLLKLESKIGIDVGNDYKVYDYMTEFSYKWVSEKNTLNNMRIPFFKGNFIKDMLKLNALVLEIQNVAEIIGDMELYSKMTDCSKLLIRDEVTPDSLYLSDKPF